MVQIRKDPLHNENNLFFSRFYANALLLLFDGCFLQGEMYIVFFFLIAKRFFSYICAFLFTFNEF